MNIAWIFVGVIVAIGIIHILALCRKIYISNHPEKFYGGEIYKAKLLSITPEIEVLNDLSKGRNIINAELKVVAEIAVQETSNNNYVREIVSGKLIPVSFVNTYHGHHSTSYSNYDHCVFVKCKDLYYKLNGILGNPFDEFDKTIESHLEEISADDLEKYLEKCKGKYGDFKSFEEYLDYIFDNGESYYKDSESKGMISESKKKQMILQKIQ